MAILLGIDLETTGIEPHLGHIIEVGVALYDTDTKMLFQEISLLVNDVNTNAEGQGWHIPRKVQVLTRMHPQPVLEHGVSLANAFNWVHKLASKADYMVAHNASFESAWILRHVPTSPLLEKPLIDTMTDLPLDIDIDRRDLISLCNKHNVPYPHAHRALHDVVAMMDVLKCYPIDKVLERASSPKIKLQAIVSFEQKDLAKAIGYGFNADNKTWTKTVKELDVHTENERATLAGFEINTVV